jgi:hypothetical protein
MPIDREKKSGRGTREEAEECKRDKEERIQRRFHSSSYVAVFVLFHFNGTPRWCGRNYQG